MVKYKVKVDREGCIGCGACVAACPNNFEMLKDGKSKEKKEIIDDSELECNQEAKEVCPVDVISVEKLD